MNAVIPPACSTNTRVPFGHEKTKRLGLPYGKYGYLGLLDLPYGKYGYLGLLDLPYGKYGYLGLLDLPSVSNENLLLGAIPDLKVGALRPSL